VVEQISDKEMLVKLHDILWDVAKFFDTSECHPDHRETKEWLNERVNDALVDLAKRVDWDKHQKKL